MVKKIIKSIPVKNAAGKAQGRKKKTIDPEEQILRLCSVYLITYHGGLLVASAACRTLVKGIEAWIVTVTLRYPTGHEGYVGDLLFDGEAFTFLTEQSVMDERVRQIASDPERARKWNEYRDSAVSPGKR